MNKILKELDRFPKGPKVSMFLEWKSMDHTFEEVRVWLSNVKSELKEKNESIPPIINRIMDDERVFGSELNLKGKLELGEKYGALYFGGDRVLSVELPIRSKDTYFLDQDFLVLPLLKFANPPVLALFVKQNSVRLYKVSNDKEIVDITHSFDFPKSSREFSHFDPGADDQNIQKGEEPRQVDHRRGYRAEVLKKFVCHIAAELSKSFGSFSKIHIFSSEKTNHLFEQEMERINRGIKVATHSFIISHQTAENFQKVIKEKVIEFENILVSEQEEEFSTAPVTNVRELIWDQEVGNLKSIRLNRKWLADALGRGDDKEQVLALNRFILDCFKKGVDVRLSDRVDGLIAGELRGDRIRVPSSYASSQFQKLETVYY